MNKYTIQLLNCRSWIEEARAEQTGLSPIDAIQLGFAICDAIERERALISATWYAERGLVVPRAVWSRLEAHNANDQH